jgi:poly(A) polymerase Pap1
MTGFIVFAAVLLVVNIWATRRLLAADEFGFRKGLAVGMVWIVPFMGIFLAKQLVPWTSAAAS